MLTERFLVTYFSILLFFLQKTRSSEEQPLHLVSIVSEVHHDLIRLILWQFSTAIEFE